MIGKDWVLGKTITFTSPLSLTECGEQIKNHLHSHLFIPYYELQHTIRVTALNTETKETYSFYVRLERKGYGVIARGNLTPLPTGTKVEYFFHLTPEANLLHFIPLSVFLIAGIIGILTLESECITFPLFGGLIIVLQIYFGIKPFYETLTTGLKNNLRASDSFTG